MLSATLIQVFESMQRADNCAPHNVPSTLRSPSILRVATTPGKVYRAAASCRSTTLTSRLVVTNRENSPLNRGMRLLDQMTRISAVEPCKPRAGQNSASGRSGTITGHGTSNPGRTPVPPETWCHADLSGLISPKPVSGQLPACRLFVRSGACRAAPAVAIDCLRCSQ